MGSTRMHANHRINIDRKVNMLPRELQELEMVLLFDIAASELDNFKEQSLEVEHLIDSMYSSLE